MLGRMQQRICALQGHNLLLHFETNRLSLRCATCGWDTPGWSVAGRVDTRRINVTARGVTRVEDRIAVVS